MPLISLEEWERIAGAQRRDLGHQDMRNIPNGIACPKCGAELADTHRDIVLTSFPPKYDVHCPSCYWLGYRTIA